MRRIVRLALAGAVVALSVQLTADRVAAAQTCECAANTVVASLGPAAAAADVVFVGEVTSLDLPEPSPTATTAPTAGPPTTTVAPDAATTITTAPAATGDTAVGLAAGVYTYTFEVSEVRKGEVDAVQEIRTLDPPACGANFPIGAPVVVFATSESTDAVPLDPGQFASTSCSGSALQRRILDAGLDLDDIGEARPAIGGDALGAPDRTFPVIIAGVLAGASAVAGAIILGTRKVEL